MTNYRSLLKSFNKNCVPKEIYHWLRWHELVGISRKRISSIEKDKLVRMLKLS